MKANFILGAGFSMPAGYPSGAALNQKFFSGVERKLLKHSSGEWHWDDYDEATSHNGRLNTDYVKYSYLLSELVEQYQLQTAKIFNYEEFYDWYLDYSTSGHTGSCYEAVNSRLSIELSNPPKASLLQEWELIDEKIYNIINYLISDLLCKPYERDQTADNYRGFLDTLRTCEEVNVFSLNHDMLVEYLFKENDLIYSDGFSENDSPIIGTNEEKLPVFQNTYDTAVKLYKLHGSIDYYIYEEANESGAHVDHTGNSWFYKPQSYYNRHGSKRVGDNGKALQSFPQTKVYPQFLTGKDKSNIIESHLIYKSMFETFENSFVNIDTLVIVGYSYGDAHINRIIKQGLDNYNFNIVNINPWRHFPFRKNYKNVQVDFLDTIEEISL